MWQQWENILKAPRSRDCLQELLQALPSHPLLRTSWVGPFLHGSDSYNLARLTFSGPNSTDPIRIGIFAGIHGDEPAGSLSVVEFFHHLVEDPNIAENFEIVAYPICNPTGFQDGTRNARNGVDLNRLFWKNSDQPEIRLLESELRSRHLHGLIQLHADDTSEGLYGFVRGATLTEGLLRPALLASAKVLPRNINAQIDGFAARDGIIYDHYDGILKAPENIEPVPFEIIFETPGKAPLDRQVEALVIVMKTILEEYRRLISFAANI